MDDLPDDLSSLLKQALARVGTVEKIWVRGSETPDTQINWRQGITFGGSWSDQLVFETDRESTARKPDWSSIGGGRRMEAPCVFQLDNFAGKPADWMPLLAALAPRDRGLFVIATSLEPGEVLDTLIINNERGIYPSAVVKPGSGNVPSLWKIQLSKLNDQDFLKELEKPSSANQAAESALVRKSASTVFLDPKEEPRFHSYLSDVALIYVGGVDYHDFARRFKSLTNAVLTLSGDPPRPDAG